MSDKTYIPKVGDFIKIRAWHGVVIDLFENDEGKTVLRVQTVRNIFRKLGPEFIELDLAPEQIAPAEIEDVQKEIEQHRKMQENALAQLLAGQLQPVVNLFAVYFNVNRAAARNAHKVSGWLAQMS